MATVWLRIGDTFRPAATSGDVDLEPVAAEGVGVPEVAGADVVVPIVHDGDRLGLLTLTTTRGQQVTEVDRRLVQDVAGNAGLLLRNVRLNAELVERAEQLRTSRRRLVEVQDRERRRLERDLHDGAQQQVVAAAMQLNVARTIAVREELPDVAAVLGELVEADQRAADQLRTIARGIYPPLLESEGLVAAIRGAARPLPVEVVLDVGELDRFDPALEASTYFCVVEALRDALRRDATTATITIRHDDGLHVGVAHDGTPGWTSHTLTALADRTTTHDGHLDTTTTHDTSRLDIALPQPHGPAAVPT